MADFGEEILEIKQFKYDQYKYWLKNSVTEKIWICSKHNFSSSIM